MKFEMAIKLCFAIEKRHYFNSNQNYSIEKSEDKKDDADAWALRITFQESTEYWIIENLAKIVKSISPNIHMEVIWEKRQMLLEVNRFEDKDKVAETLDQELSGLQLDEEEKEEEQ